MTATEVIFALTAAGIIIYSGVIWLCWHKWPQLPRAHFQPDANLLRVTVVVVARNEEKNIGKLIEDLARQTYPSDLLKVLLLNDGCEDQTVAKARAEAAKQSLNLTSLVVNVPDGFIGSHKKLAIMQAAQYSTADILVLTDADCRVGVEWIATHVSYYQSFPEVRLVFGSFLFENSGSIWHGLLNLEALNLAGVSAATNLMRKPGMCSGANLSCRREVIAVLAPYQDNLTVASGDDEFLLHTVVKHYPNAAFFNHHPQSLVVTLPPASAKEFFYQRKRWAGKWKFYSTPWPLRLALVVLAGNLGHLTAWLLLLFSGNLLFFLFILVKWIPELLLSHRVATHFGRRQLLRFFVPMEIIYPFYAFFFAIASNFGKYRWKGRTYP